MQTNILQVKVKSNFLLYGLIIVAIIILTAIYFNTHTWDRGGQPQHVSIQGFGVLNVHVTNVNPIIARQFKLPMVTGVLVNDTPQGTARRLSGLKRGDIILKHNNIPVQSTVHLGHLMSQDQPGDHVTFLIWRNGKTVSQSMKIPQTAKPIDISNPNVMRLSAVLIILFLTFTALFLNLINRTVCVVLGAVLMMVSGSVLGFYNQTQAFSSIYMSPLMILIGMSIFSIYLEDLKFFDYVAKNILVKLKADTEKVALTLTFLSYFFSLFVNNLTTILVMVPITLALYRELKINPVPVVIAEVIASNVGGASTMIGDFPNMLISSATGLLFVDFLIFMAPMCIILLVALCWYMKKFEFSKMEKIKSVQLQMSFLKKLETEVHEMDIDWASVKRGIAILFSVIAAFIILPVFGIKSATIALGGGFILLALDNSRAVNVLKKISFQDFIFFIALFIIVGGALHSGLLQGISEALQTFSGGNRTVYLVSMMWTAAFFTAFLNAGPSAAFFLPIVMQSPFAGFSDLVWWALSLGILAGSNSTITGATAGVVMQTILDEHDNKQTKIEDKYHLTFSNFSQRGIPIAIMFLMLSSVYIAVLSNIAGL